MQGIYTILLLLASNIFMTLAWYGHLKMAEFSVLAFHMQIKWNHIVAGVLLILAVYFVFK